MNIAKSEKEKLCKVMAESLPLFRTKLGLSQEGFAQHLEVTRQTISAFENGQRIMPWHIFLSCMLIFKSNPATGRLIDAMKLYTDSVKIFLEN